MRLRPFLAALALTGALACSDNTPTDNTPTAPTDHNNAPSAALTATGPIIQSVTGTLQGGGTFAGTLTITQLTRSATGALLATGTLVGTATQGTTVTQITQSFTVPLAINPAGSCRILHLDLGPIFLDLLGLQVSLNEVILDVTAVSGPGNLLGNLLCAVAHLLDGTPNLTALDRLLAQINAILGAL